MPAGLAISAFAPWALTPVLMFGGAFLCYEGFEKLAHRLMHDHAEDHAHHEQLVQALADPKADRVVLEREKIAGAVRTDFILSAEIIAITLGAVTQASFATQVAVLAGIGVLMTVGVYGIVPGIDKLEDAGLRLSQRDGESTGVSYQLTCGAAIPKAAPLRMKFLSIAGTAAIFFAGCGIHDAWHSVAARCNRVGRSRRAVPAWAARPGRRRGADVA
jgi:predicted DNA repair protein MutK